MEDANEVDRCARGGTYGADPMPMLLLACTGVMRVSSSGVDSADATLSAGAGSVTEIWGTGLLTGVAMAVNSAVELPLGGGLIGLATWAIEVGDSTSGGDVSARSTGGGEATAATVEVALLSAAPKAPIGEGDRLSVEDRSGVSLADSLDRDEDERCTTRLGVGVESEESVNTRGGNVGASLLFVAATDGATAALPSPAAGCDPPPSRFFFSSSSCCLRC